MRVVVFDRTDKLAAAWRPGALLYRGLRRIDATYGATSWDDAIAWLASRPEPIRELQYWGHGTWGTVLVNREAVDASTLSRLAPVRAALAPDALVWFRTCETFGSPAGLDFAARAADYLGARVAGHTYVIGYYQSGLHGLAPGVAPDWSPREGVVPGVATGKPSGRGEPNTITCLRGTVPRPWFAR